MYIYSGDPNDLEPKKGSVLGVKTIHDLVQTIDKGDPGNNQITYPTTIIPGDIDMPDHPTERPAGSSTPPSPKSEKDSSPNKDALVDHGSVFANDPLLTDAIAGAELSSPAIENSLGKMQANGNSANGCTNDCPQTPSPDSNLYVADGIKA